MQTAKFDKEHIFPVIYNDGLLFQLIDVHTETYYLFKNNTIKVIKNDELKDKDIQYPSTLEETTQIIQIIELAYNRMLYSCYYNDNLLELIRAIKLRVEKNKKIFLIDGLK